MTRGNWRTCVIGDLIESEKLFLADGYRAKNAEFTVEGLPFARAKNINDGFNFDGADKLLPGHSNRIREKISQVGDVVCTSKGTVGRPAYVRETTPAFIYSPQLSYWRSLDPEVIDPRWLYYWMCGQEFRAQVTSTKGQTDIAPYLSLSDQRLMRITLPPIAEQCAIADCLGAFDDKIEKNRETVRLLEGLARMIFRDWFVNFRAVRAKVAGAASYPFMPRADFAALPTRFTDSPLGPIPEGFEVASLSSIARITTGKRTRDRSDRPATGCTIPLYGGAGQIGYVPEPLYRDPILFTGRVGTLGLVFRTTEPSWLSDNTLLVNPQDGFFDFTYCLLKEFDLKRLNRGSTQPLISRKDLSQQRFVLPGTRLVESFASTARLLFSKIDSLNFESCRLATVRDSLMPGLIANTIRLDKP